MITRVGVAPDRRQQELTAGDGTGRLLRLAHAACRLLSPQPDHILALVIMTALLVCVTAAPLIAPHDPYDLDMLAQLQPPSTTHWFGTDDVGRDIFSRVVYGARFSLAMGLVVTAVSVVLGVTFGAAAGLLGSKADEAIMRVCDLFLGFPPFLLAMSISAVLGSNLTNAVIAAAAVWWPAYVRLMRSQVLAVKNELYIEATRAVGATWLRLVLRHLLPNCWAPMNVRMTMDLGRAVLFISALSFIGLGASPPTPEWGTMLAESRSHLISAWWYPTFPGLAIFLAVLGFSLLGDILDSIYRPS